MIIENVENEVDPMLDPVLDKQIIKKGHWDTVIHALFASA